VGALSPTVDICLYKLAALRLLLTLAIEGAILPSAQHNTPDFKFFGLFS
jgi:hypothetical protein